MLILLSVAWNSFTYIHRVDLAREKYRIVSQIRGFRGSLPADTPVYITGLPSPFSDVVQAGDCYGIDVILGDGHEAPARAARFRFVSGSLEPAP